MRYPLRIYANDPDGNVVGDWLDAMRASNAPIHPWIMRALVIGVRTLQRQGSTPALGMDIQVTGSGDQPDERVMPVQPKREPKELKSVMDSQPLSPTTVSAPSQQHPVTDHPTTPVWQPPVSTKDMATPETKSHKPVNWGAAAGFMEGVKS
ncbi:hypothetical protein A4U49_04340 [Acidithiobacillus ferrivorans]|uniref:hypothetical protein n=1 Tax=Acidithiobacillus ferrivorans TaxID=160808 RepID=UPI0008940B55|nr:hypothetical protein [Acidithiobacillus ferrivorans]OFA17016.1 hypothetical protein A4U49_04340 [Acidithiobacillus ferrivorans]